MKFVFALEQVLKAREAQEQREAASLASMLMERMKLGEEESRLEEMLRSSYQIGTQSVPITAYKRIHSEKMIIIRTLSEIRDQKGSLTHKIETQRAKMVQAGKAKKILEKLKERRYQEFMIKMEQEEQKMLNEWGFLSYNRQN